MKNMEDIRPVLETNMSIDASSNSATNPAIFQVPFNLKKKKTNMKIEKHFSTNFFGCISLRKLFYL